MIKIIKPIRYLPIRDSIAFIQFALIIALFSSIIACGGKSTPNPVNNSPVANAGPDQTVNENVTVQLTGEASDPDDDAVTFEWSQDSGPSVTLSSTTSLNVSFDIGEVPIANDDPIVLSLTVTDSKGATSSDQITINVTSTNFVIFMADKDEDNIQELYKYNPETDSSIKLSGSMVNGGDVKSYVISPDKSWVAYLADQETDGVDELYIAATDGSGINKINIDLPANGDVSEFVWSPDSSQIAYTADIENDEITEVYLADPDGTNHRKINGNVGASPVVYLTAIRWSPDSRYLAQMVFELSSTSIVGINTHDTQAGGFSSVRVNPALVDGGAILGYEWSPDSSQILYRSDQEVDEIFELYTTSPDIRESIKVNGDLVENGDVSDFAWSPDSSRILYRADQETNNVSELYTVLADGTENTKVSGTLVEGGNVYYVYAWSPDSTRILYEADQETDNVFELYTVLPDGTENIKVSGTLVEGGDIAGDDDSFAWSPDSSRIMYIADQETDQVFELYSVLPDGTDNFKVSAPLIESGNLVDFRWSPDSSRVVYYADQDEDNVFELYATLADGSENFKVNISLLNTGNVYDFCWSLDNSRIMYRAQQDEDSPIELYLSTTDGVSQNISRVSVEGGNVSNFVWSDDNINCNSF